MKNIKECIKKYKKHNQRHIEKYIAEINDYLDKNGIQNTDYISSRREMLSYHRGAWNALNELERMMDHQK